MAIVESDGLTRNEANFLEEAGIASIDCPLDMAVATILGG
jgi:hypothetical protein